MISGSGKPLTNLWGQRGRYVQIMVFECHGLVPAEFSFGDGWKAQSVIVRISIFVCYTNLLLVSSVW